MDADIKTKWVEALRSGDYTQGKSVLQNCNGDNCCLGVLARVNGAPMETINNYNEFSIPVGSEIMGFTSMVPAGYCGLSDDDITELIMQNDVQRKSFEEIAKYIEENL